MEFDRVGKYQILHEIGRGTMGRVFKAQDPVLGRFVAVKTLSYSLGATEESRKRFHREAQAAAVLSHPNIVTVHDFGEEKGLIYMAMELLEGKDLRDALADGDLRHPGRQAPRHGAGHGRAFVRPLQGRHPPRPEAGEHPHPAERPGEDRGLRPRAAVHVRDDPGRDRPRDPQLHVAGAGPRRQDRRALGRVRGGCGLLRGARPAASPSTPSRRPECSSRWSTRSPGRCARWCPKPRRSWPRWSRRR